jgi:hypothetical protein
MNNNLHLLPNIRLTTKEIDMKPVGLIVDLFN